MVITCPQSPHRKVSGILEDVFVTVKWYASCPPHPTARTRDARDRTRHGLWDVACTAATTNFLRRAACAWANGLLNTKDCSAASRGPPTRRPPATARLRRRRCAPRHPSSRRALARARPRLRAPGRRRALHRVRAHRGRDAAAHDRDEGLRAHGACQRHRHRHRAAARPRGRARRGLHPPRHQARERHGGARPAAPERRAVPDQAHRLRHRASHRGGRRRHLRHRHGRRLRHARVHGRARQGGREEGGGGPLGRGRRALPVPGRRRAAVGAGSRAPGPRPGQARCRGAAGAQGRRGQGALEGLPRGLPERAALHRSRRRASPPSSRS